MKFFDSLAESDDEDAAPKKNDVGPAPKKNDVGNAPSPPTVVPPTASAVFERGSHRRDAVFEQMTITLCRNTCRLLDGLPSKSEHRRHLMATLLDGIGHQDAARCFNLNVHTARAHISAPGRARHGVERLKWLSSKEKREVRRPKLTKEETLTSFDAMKEKLKTRSGTANETHYHACSESLCEECVLKFRDAAKRMRTNKLATIPSQPRSHRAFQTHTLKNFPCVQRTKAHPCPRCNDAKVAERELKSVDAHLAMADDPEEVMSL